VNVATTATTAKFSAWNCATRYARVRNSISCRSLVSGNRNSFDDSERWRGFFSNGDFTAGEVPRGGTRRKIGVIFLLADFTFNRHEWQRKEFFKEKRECERIFQPLYGDIIHARFYENSARRASDHINAVITDGGLSGSVVLSYVNPQIRALRNKERRLSRQ